VTVCYIRHGENRANLTGELSCRKVDYPLTDRGAGQAREVAERLSGEATPAAIYSSPLRRAAQTADIIAGRLGLPVVTLEDLRELDVGDLEGRSDEAAWKTYLEVAYAWLAGDHDRRYPGGEDFHQVIARVTRALARAAGHPPGSRVLMIAHDGLIRVALPALCPSAEAPGTGLPQCGLAELAVSPAHDATSHPSGPPGFSSRSSPSGLFSNGVRARVLSWPSS
jgi:probable phosphoglycerate mutase